MLNWLSYGVVNIAGYVANTLFFIDVLIWFLLVRKNMNIRENRKIMIKTGVISLIGAAIAPLLIVIVSGNLFPFLSSAWKVIQKIDSFASFKALVSAVFKGFSITGGILILSIVLLFFVKKAKRLTFAILYPFPLFAALTRINCFIEGCCFGKLSNDIFAVSYPPASPASKLHYSRSLIPSRFVPSLNVHPTQLYIFAAMFFLFAALVIMNKLKVKKNIIAGTALSGYGFFNFFIEFSREEPVALSIFTMGQILEFIIFLLGFYLVFKVKEEEISEK